MKNNLFDIEYQYELYLERVGLKRSEMQPVQAIETKRAFFGACGQMLILMRDDMPDNENEAVKLLQGMHDQVGDFWSKEGYTLPPL